MNEWKELYKQILEPDLRMMYGKIPRRVKKRKDMRLTIRLDLGMSNEIKDTEIIDRDLDKWNIIYYLIMRDLSKERPNLKKKVVKITRRKFVSGIKMEINLKVEKRIGYFFSIILKDIKRKMLKKSENNYELIGLTPFFDRKYIKTLLEVEKLKKMKMDITNKEKDVFLADVDEMIFNLIMQNE